MFFSHEILFLVVLNFLNTYKKRWFFLVSQQVWCSGFGSAFVGWQRSRCLRTRRSRTEVVWIVAADIAITRRGFIINIAIDRGEIRACRGGGEEVRSNEAAAEGVVEEVFGRAARIVDGDTFWLARLKVRLWGVDSPELQQGCVAEGKVWHCGEEARAKLRSIVAGGEVRCVVRGRSYDRVVGRCFVGSEDIGEALVVGGLAVEDARYSGGTYGVRQAEARMGAMGMWRGCFTEPRRWRARQRDCGE